MDEKVEFDNLEESLKRCGAGWGCAQSHGLLTGKLAVSGVPAGPDWLLQVLEDVDKNNAQRTACEKQLDILYQATYWQLSERLSEFEPLLPHEDEEIGLRSEALAHWCEGFLHGLVSAQHTDALKKRLGAEPISDVIKDMVQLTRAGLDTESDLEENEGAYVELVEYVRVAAQLCFEELADLRQGQVAS